MIKVLTLLRDHPEGLSGYAIRRKACIGGPTVYKMIERFVEDGWATRTTMPSPHRGAPNLNLITLTTLGQEKTTEVLSRTAHHTRVIERG